jgi:hypothetical protein
MWPLTPTIKSLIQFQSDQSPTYCNIPSLSTLYVYLASSFEFDFNRLSSLMPQAIIRSIFNMLSIYDHADLSSVSQFICQIARLPASS